MRQIWSLALACLTKLKILTKHERILISYKFFHIKVSLRARHPYSSIWYLLELIFLKLS